jgi:hypothetical protein
VTAWPPCLKHYGWCPCPRTCPCYQGGDCDDGGERCREKWEREQRRKIGLVERHYLLCPYCQDRADLIDHRCLSCGALAVAVIWEPSSPELALVSRRREIRSRGGVT